MTPLLLCCLTLLFLWSLCAARPTENPTYISECLYKGHRVALLSDRLQVDGKDVLVLDKVNHKWTRADGHQDPALTNLDTLQILEECEELKKEFSRVENSADASLFRVTFIVLLILFFIGFVVLNFMMSNSCGHGAAGGVLGSIVHYPAH